MATKRFRARRRAERARANGLRAAAELHETCGPAVVAAQHVAKRDGLVAPQTEEKDASKQGKERGNISYRASAPPGLSLIKSSPSLPPWSAGWSEEDVNGI